MIDWQNKTFPKATRKDFEEKLIDELNELKDAIASGDDFDIMAEIADVAILSNWLVDNITNSQLEIGDVMLIKHEQNKRRVFSPAGQHYPQNYLDLVERVRAIDPAAAEYMLTVEKLFENFDGGLIRTFDWFSTPQKFHYWNSIYKRLKNEK